VLLSIQRFIIIAGDNIKMDKQIKLIHLCLLIRSLILLNIYLCCLFLLPPGVLTINAKNNTIYFAGQKNLSISALFAGPLNMPLALAA
jgi:hypothetical protein